VVSCFAWAGGILEQSGPLPIVEAWKHACGELLWRTGGILLWWWSRSTTELLLLLLWLLLLKLPRLELWAIALILLLLWSTQLTHEMGHTPCGTWGSTASATTTSGSRHHLLPLLFINLDNCLHHSLLINGRTCQLIVRQAGELYQALLQVDGESSTVQVDLFLICIDMV
jgi:hypothetical protein